MSSSFNRILFVSVSIIALSAKGFSSTSEGKIPSFGWKEDQPSEWAATRPITSPASEGKFGLSLSDPIPPAFDLRRNYLNSGLGLKQEYKNNYSDLSDKDIEESINEKLETEIWPKLWPVYDQGKINSCVLNALAGLLMFNHLVHPATEGQTLLFSRRFIYFNAMYLDGIISDKGAILQDIDVKSGPGISLTTGMRAIHDYGDCAEEKWPYDEQNIYAPPSADVYKRASAYVGDPRPFDVSGESKYVDLGRDGIADRILSTRVDKTLEAIKDILYNKLKPIAFGLYIKDPTAFYKTGRDGYLDNSTVPSINEPAVKKNGHCMVIIGYDDKMKHFIVRNSFGTGWGRYGHCFIPQHYVLSDWAGSGSDKYDSTDGHDYFWAILNSIGPEEEERIKREAAEREKREI